MRCAIILLLLCNCAFAERKVEYFLWLPDPQHVENYETRQCWEMNNFLKKHEKELDELCDFRIINLNEPGNRIIDDEVVESFSLRIGGKFTKHRQALLDSPEDYLKHLKYLIRLDTCIVEHKNFDYYFFDTTTYRAKTSGLDRWMGIYVVDTIKVNPELKVFPPIKPINEFDYCEAVMGDYVFKVSKEVPYYENKLKKQLKLLRKADFDSGILEDIIADKEAELERRFKNKDSFSKPN